ncbi:MAG: hypothetical protein C3F06_02965 [Candidatus Methanoperedenaceae archaeon]|nr:MAG: hypothetical protein C3F06_02965 [Candidatus Methanoperedenaceae archaeon]
MMRRSRMDIVVDVLEAAKNGVNKTAIVYRTNLNFTLAEKYLELLEKQGLLENKSDKYITSDKGKVFLAKAKEITMQLETPFPKIKEKKMHNEDPSSKIKQMTLQYEAPIQKTQEMILQHEAPIQKTQEMILQHEAPIQKTQEMILQHESPIQKMQEMILQHEAPQKVGEMNLQQDLLMERLIREITIRRENPN